MDEVNLSLYLVLLLLLILSAFFSSSETAFSSASIIRLRKYEKEGKLGSKKAIRIAENFDETLTTILVGNNIVNIAMASISTILFVSLLGESLGTLISTFGVTILVLIFGEVLPKSFAKEYPEKFALKVSGILYILIKLLKPVNYLFSKLKAFIAKIIGNKNNEPTITEEELKVMVGISQEEGSIDLQEMELVKRSFDFDNIVVGEILTHRTDMTAINIEEDIDKIKETFIEEKYSKIPVFDEDVDNIVGILYERDLFTELIYNKDIDIRKLLREPRFVSENMKISDLLKELQKDKNKMAIAVDEYGGTSGLVTLEDILEELVGEIWHEHDVKEVPIIEKGNNEYEVSSKLSLEDFNRKFDVSVPVGTYYTLGGLIISELGKIPDVGDEIFLDNIRVVVTSMNGRRVNKVSIYVEQLEMEEMTV